MRIPARLLQGLVAIFLILGIFEVNSNGPADLQAAPMVQSQVVDIRLISAITNVHQGESFTVDIQVEPNGQETTGVQTFIDFNPSHLQVTEVIPTPGSPLTVILANTHDNSEGTVDFAAGVFTGGSTTTFTMATVTFSFGQCANEQTIDLVFSSQPPRNTIASIGGEEIQQGLFGVSISIDPDVPNCIPVPSVSQWGLISMAGLLAGVFLWRMRRITRWKTA